MVRDKNRVYAEINSEKTVKTDNFLVTEKFVVGDNTRELKTYSPINSLLLTDVNGEIQNLEIPSGALGYNRYLGCDSAGNLIWI